MKNPVSSKQREREFLAKRGRESSKNSGTEGATAARGASGNGRVDSKNPPRPDKSIRRQYLNAYIAWLWPRRFAILIILMMALTVAALDMVWPLGIKLIIDAVSSATSKSRPINLGVGQIGIAV